MLHYIQLTAIMKFAPYITAFELNYDINYVDDF